MKKILICAITAALLGTIPSVHADTPQRVEKKPGEVTNLRLRVKGNGLDIVRYEVRVTRPDGSIMTRPDGKTQAIWSYIPNSDEVSAGIIENVPIANAFAVQERGDYVARGKVVAKDKATGKIIESRETEKSVFTSVCKIRRQKQVWKTRYVTPNANVSYMQHWFPLAPDLEPDELAYYKGWTKVLGSDRLTMPTRWVLEDAPQGTDGVDATIRAKGEVLRDTFRYLPIPSGSDSESVDARTAMAVGELEVHGMCEWENEDGSEKGVVWQRLEVVGTVLKMSEATTGRCYAPDAQIPIPFIWRKK